MTSITSLKLQTVYQLLSERSLAVISYISDDLKCDICTNILINACQTDCGCNFCKRCIEDYIKNGGICCPGNTDECKDDNLSNITIDKRANRLISQLVVKCMEKDCDFECQLINFMDHIKICTNRKFTCPFKTVGCAEEKMSEEKINEHLQINSYIHNKLLIELVNNLKGDINILRENEEKNKKEIAMLKSKMEISNEEIIAMKENVLEMKVEKETLNSEIKALNEKIDILTLNEEENKQKIQSLKEAIKKNHQKNDSMNLQIDKIKKRLQPEMTEMNAKINERFEMINEDIISKKTELDTVSRKMDEWKEKCDGEITKRLLKLEKYLDMRDGTFEWHIGAIEKLEKDQFIYSEYFYERNNLHKMRLQSCYTSDDKQLKIILLIYDGDKNMEWPFRAIVEIKISDKFPLLRSKSFKKSCVVKKSSTIPQFTFHKGELSHLVSNPNCVISCSIDYNKIN